MAFDETAFHGTWRIVECVSLAGTVETTGIEGTEFHLDEVGDVSWKVSDDAEPMPFFNCETYEVTSGDQPLLKFIGTYAGHVIEFKVEVSDDLMLLTYERCCMLQCQKVSSCDPKDDVPFSFLGALGEGYFSDLTIKADTGEEFKVHTVILRLAAPEIDWSCSPPPLSGLSAEVLSVTLHYLYAECLPQGLSEESARACIRTVGKLPGFQRFSAMCETFLKNTALKQQITSLITDMHACADKVIELFSGKTSGGSPEGIDESLMNNPAKLCYTVRQALREASVACAKLLILCDLFSKRKGELSREERHEIMKYAKSRFPIFMNQLHKFLEVCRQHSANISAPQRHEIAIYLVPELEVILDLISTFAVDTKSALEQVISSSSSSDPRQDRGEKAEKHKKGHVGDVLGKALKTALHVKELKKLKNFHERASASFTHLMLKKDNFTQMTQADKERSVSKNLELLFDEIPLFLIRLEELMAALDDKVTWREWKYLFKLGTSKVAWGLAKVQSNKAMLQPLINQACDIISCDPFTAMLVSLGLTAPEPSSETLASASACSKPPPTPTKYAQLSSVESLCMPPYARESRTAQHALELFRKGEATDMSFEIVINEGGDTVIDHTHGIPLAHTDESEAEVHVIKAHCVLVAARCDWFRRALLSGMRESINKKITIHDSNPELFRWFLEYLYSGQLDTNDLSTEQLADMMILCDRYELDSLKSVCEHALKHHLDDETALYLLSLADQLHAQALKENALNYVVEHPTVAESEVFEDLPEHLQTEVADSITWNGLDPRSRGRAVSQNATPSSMSSVSEVDELVSNLDLDRPDLSTSSSSEDLHFVEDPSRLDNCLSALRDIVGDTVPREELVRVALAADYDVNRALNFFFSS